jgi:hypothetical protein
MQVRPCVPSLPLTDQFHNFIPPFLLRGTASTTRHTLANALTRNRETVRIFLQAILDPQSRLPGEKMLSILSRLSTVAISEVEGTDAPFGFSLFDHLTDCANNAFRAQTLGIAWI